MNTIHWLLVCLFMAWVGAVIVIVWQALLIREFRSVVFPCERCGREWGTLVWHEGTATSLCGNCIADLSGLKNEGFITAPLNTDRFARKPIKD